MGRGRRQTASASARAVGGKKSPASVAAIGAVVRGWLERRMNGYPLRDLVNRGVDAVEAEALLDDLCTRGYLRKSWEVYCRDCHEGIEVLDELPGESWQQLFFQCPHAVTMTTADARPTYSPTVLLKDEGLPRDFAWRRPSPLAE